jgi:hypothetical protein
LLEKFWVKQWADKMCISPSLRKSEDQQKYITSNKCETNDEQKFIIDSLGRLSQKSQPNLCLASYASAAISEVQPYGFIHVSASLSDSRVDPYSIIDPNSVGWWASPLGLK